MVKSCALCKAKRTEKSRIVLHKFPKNLKKYKLWKKICGFNDEDDMSKSYICSRHFTPSDYIDMKAKEFGGRMSLIFGAHPSVSVPNKNIQPLSVDIKERKPQINHSDIIIQRTGMNINDETGHMHFDDTRDIIKKEIHIKTEYEDTDEHEVKTATEHTSEWENGIKDEVTDDVYHSNTNIEEIYIMSEPVNTSEYEDESENAAVANTESRDTRNTCIISSTDDMSQYNYNTNIIINEEINIKSECVDNGECEERAAGKDTGSATSFDNSDASWLPVSVNKFKQVNTTQITEACYKCDVCEATFEKSRDLAAHKSLHNGEKRFKCDQCNNTFSDSSNLNRHKRKHSGEKQFKCDQCDKSFSEKWYLVKHIRVHSGEKPFKCDQCDKAFTQSAHLIRHKRLHSGEKPFKCDQCDKAFSESSNLINHKRLHSGEKPFKCEQCDKAFSNLSNLINHKRVHSGEKIFKCDQCDKTFSRTSNLNSHKRIHSSEKPFICKLCNKSFKANESLIRHKRTHPR